MLSPVKANPTAGAMGGMNRGDQNAEGVAV